MKTGPEPNLIRAGSPPPAEPFLRFWGVRGSVPVPGPETVRYGGNTACVEVRAGGQILILDAGTGLRALGEALSAEFDARAIRASLLITHPHWDHVQGFPFFKPIYDATTQLRVLGFPVGGEGLATIFSRQMAPPYFPLSLSQLPAQVQFDELTAMELPLGPIQLRAAFVNHPGVCAGYRLEGTGLSVAYLPDYEPFHRTAELRRPDYTPSPDATASEQTEDQRLLAFLGGVGVLILDAQFDAEEYPARVGWGHSSVEDAVSLAARAGAGRLFLFHHDPSHSDAHLDRMVDYAQKLARKLNPYLAVDAAREGLCVELPDKPHSLGGAQG